MTFGVAQSAHPRAVVASARTSSLLLWLTAALLACALTGCKPKHRDERFIEPTSSRPYRVVAPAENADAPKGARPVLFSLHPYQTAPEAIVDYFQLINHAVDKRGFLLVVPEGTKDTAGKPHWNASVACCGEGPRADDLAYLQGVLRDVQRRFKVDTKRVYAFGMSNGAMMAQRWACAPEGQLAAVVSISGAYSGPDDPPCVASREVSVIEVHGTADELVRYEGKQEGDKRYPSARQTVAAWVASNHASPKSVITRKRSDLKEDIEIETWTAGKSRVSLWTIHGADHFVTSAGSFVADFFTLFDSH